MIRYEDYLKPSKMCPRCKINFRKPNSGYCRPCNALNSQKWRDKNKDKAQQLDREWKLKNSDKFKATKAASIVKRNYGITLAEKEIIRKFQNDCCAICKNELKIANVDHCHATGETRGLLCWHCNNALGKFRDNVKMLREAADYLEHPTVEKALGERRFGLPGRITTKRSRRLMLAKKSGIHLSFYRHCAPELLGIT